MPRLASILTAAAAVLCSALGASRTLSTADVPLEVGAPLHLDCGVRGNHRHCLWETEDGRVLQVEDVHAGRHAGLRAPDNLTHNQCGIVVEQASARDAGAWTCKVFLPGEALTTVRSVGGRHARGASLTLGAADVPLEVGALLHLDCGVRGHHRHCLWETEDGRVLQVEDVHAGRHAGLRAPDNLTHNQCGIVVEQASERDAGTWTCKVFLPGEALTTVRSVGGKHARACYYPFEPVGGGCFHFGEDTAMTWYAARDYCKSLLDGADLAVVDECHLMQQLWSHIMTNYGGGDHWLGATDDHQEGMWEWVDGTAVTLGTPFWIPPQPDNAYDGENCLHMRFETRNGYFNDYDCNYVSPFLCQDHFSTPS